MSVEQMAAVFRHSKSKLTARLVLLALADVAADDGRVTAYARSHRHLARKANCDTGSVGRAIDKLVELGELEVLDVGDGRASSNYALHVKPEEPPQIEGPQIATPAPADRAPRVRELPTQGGQNALPIIPSLSDVSRPPSSDTRPDRFEEFWSAFEPKVRRVGKGDARKAWATAIKSADPAVILEGLARYSAEIVGRDPKYLKTPGPWLRAERWLDEPGANRGRARPSGAGAGAIIGRDPAAPQGRVAAGDL